MNATSAWALALSLSLGIVNAAFADASSGGIDWKGRVRAEIPKEYSRLREAVGGWQGSYTQSIWTSPSPSRASTQTKRPKEVTLKTDYFYSAAIGGMKLITRDASDGEEDVLAGNHEYDFSLQKGASSQTLHITKYAPTPTHRIDDNRWLLSAYNVCAMSLSDLIAGKAGQLKSATPMDLDGRPQVRLDFDRKFTDTEKLWPGWVIVDPNFHWAITAYEQHYPWGLKNGTLEYTQQDKQFALPKRMIEHDIDGAGRTARTYTIVFTAPEPCRAVAVDFTLQAFGLEPPHLARETGGGKVSKFALFNVGLLVVLGMWFSYLFYRGRRRTQAAE
jgi:hypothetical protein